MKSFFAALVISSCFSCLSVSGEETPRKFIEMIVDYDFPDETSAFAGNVFVVLDFRPDGYVTYTEGKKQIIPIKAAKSITSEEAAMSLIREREILYSSISRLINEKLEATNLQADQNDNGRLKYSNAQRSKMLRVLRSAGMISSIRKSQGLSDEELQKLHQEALRILELRGIKEAIEQDF